MAVSMKELFRRQGLDGEVISLRNSLANHSGGLKMGLLKANRLFHKPADGDGFRRGCQRPFHKNLDLGTIANIFTKDSDKEKARELSYLVPAWVSVHDQETRTVEGILTKSKLTHEDFPPAPWHTYYDWNFFVLVDEQYRYLLSKSNLDREDAPDGDTRGIMECEWDTDFFPGRKPQEKGEPIMIWPQVGDRVWIVGRWIYDCGHPRTAGHRTEIHPPKAMAFFRPGAAKFDGNSGLTRANNAVLFIGRNGGYWRQSINDQNYDFDLYLPPKPYPEAQPVWKWEEMTALPVLPQIAPYPVYDPKALRVEIPLKGVKQHPEEYSAIISGGWSDPRRTESKKIKSLRVTIEKIFIDSFHAGDKGAAEKDKIEEWNVYIGINGIWHVRSLNVRKGEARSLNVTEDLRLHPDDRIHITACGFEADVMHELIGKKSGFTWLHISDPALTEKQRIKIMEKVVEKGLDKTLGVPMRDPTNVNEPLGLFSKFHSVRRIPSGGTRVHGLRSEAKDYRLKYTITPI